MFFRKKRSDKSEPKLEALKTENRHTKYYHLSGDEANDSPLPELPLEPKALAAETQSEETAADEIYQTGSAPAAAEIETEAGNNIESPGQKPDSPEAQPTAIQKNFTDKEIPQSQAVKDILDAGLTVEKAAAKTSADSDDDGKKVENLATVARFRWYALLFLAEISVLSWAIEAQVSGRPYIWPAWSTFIATFILGCLTFKFFRIPTRAGLAALGWGVSYLVSALYGPQETFYHSVPAALIWSGLLTLIMLWVGVAIWRKIGRYKVVDVVLSVILIYAALGPIWALADNIAIGAALNLSFKVLAASPRFLTAHLPWFLWPITISVAIVLPLAAFFSLWDQFTALKKRGARHGGNFFLALAFLCLIPYGFLSFDRAVAEQPGWAGEIRALLPLPEAAEYARENQPAAPGVVPSPTYTPQPDEITPKSQAPLSTTPALEISPSPTPAIIENSPAIETPEIAESPQLYSESAPPPHLEVETPAAAPESLEERLNTTEQRLNLALERLEELEERMKKITESSEKTKQPPLSEPAPADPDYQEMQFSFTTPSTSPEGLILI